MQATPSITAMATAVARGRHRAEHAPPWVLDDTHALELVGPAWTRFRDGAAERYGPDVDRAFIAAMVVRSRYAEDRLAASGARQYVVLGAGLDTFAWRRPPGLEDVHVFEVDHPASQAFKRERAAALGIADPVGVTYVPVDFERETLPDALAAAGFDGTQPAFCAWLGVTMYLSVEAIEATLRTVAGWAPGSEIVLSYGRTDAHLDDLGRAFRAVAVASTTRLGEPFVTQLSRDDADALVVRCGLRVTEHPDREELVARYFAGRADDLRPFTSEGLLAAA